MRALHLYDLDFHSLTKMKSLLIASLCIGDSKAVHELRYKWTEAVKVNVEYMQHLALKLISNQSGGKLGRLCMLKIGCCGMLNMAGERILCEIPVSDNDTLM